MFKSPKPQSLETYLSQIEHELRDLPSQARADEMREIESHLRALVLAGQQLENLSQVQATVVGIKQFGAPRVIGRNLRRAWERKQPEAWWRVALAPIFAMAFSAYFAEPFAGGFYDFYSPFNMASIVTVTFFFTLFTTYIMDLISPKRIKVVIGIFLILFFVPNIWNEVLFSSLWTIASFVSVAVAAITGSHFGARHSRKFSVRIAK